MAVRRVPTGFRFLLGVFFFILTFLLVRPSDPVTKGEYRFWNNAASLFGENDVDGFVGVALLVISAVTTFVSYQISIRLIESYLNKRQ
ncbi:hypothetical protein [Winslowiella iniecta]|uniref:hypothetical protein n=1 Tax=Winslowiella iniecta TaxID=1560201 RepID=UPI00092D6C74|nr:hypothetical protein [Winslowiella iniecta]